jgi:hypothetical protein
MTKRTVRTMRCSPIAVFVCAAFLAASPAVVQARTSNSSSKPATHHARAGGTYCYRAPAGARVCMDFDEYRLRFFPT